MIRIGLLGAKRLGPVRCARRTDLFRDGIEPDKVTAESSKALRLGHELLPCGEDSALRHARIAEEAANLAKHLMERIWRIARDAERRVADCLGTGEFEPLDV